MMSSVQAVQNSVQSSVQALRVDFKGQSRPCRNSPYYTRVDRIFHRCDLRSATRVI
jgi:hypothetical protein